MIGIFHETIHTIPCLVVVEVAKAEERLPVLTYFHGFTGAKENNLHLAYLLAEKGYRVILPDSIYHGEREDNISETKRQMYFWDIIMKNIEELQTIHSYFDKKQLILDERFGIAGTSMGGITSAAALTQYDWIKATAILMGTPKLSIYAKKLISNLQQTDMTITQDAIDTVLEQLETYDLSMQMDTLNERPLLFWHGERDSVVPFDHSYDFYKEAINYYADSKNITFLKEADSGHKVSRYAILETVSWFSNHL